MFVCCINCRQEGRTAVKVGAPGPEGDVGLYFTCTKWADPSQTWLGTMMGGLMKKAWKTSRQLRKRCTRHTARPDRRGGPTGVKFKVPFQSVAY